MARTRTLTTALVFALAGGCATTPEKKPEPAPQPPPAEQAPVEAWRQNPPVPAAPPELLTPTFQKASLPNGMELYVSERHDLPIVSMGVAFAAGSAQDPAGKAGLADLTMRTLLEGAGKRDAIALEEAFAELGATPSAAARPDGAFVGTTALTRNAPQAMALLADVVLRPTLKAEDFKRKQREHLNTLARQAGNPGFLAQEAFTAAIYGEGHPYGSLTSGVPATVAKLTAKDAQTWYRSNVGPKAAALVVTGDVTLEQAKQWAEQYFGKWKGAAARPPKPSVVKNGKRERVLVPKPGLAQTIIVMGRPSIESGNPDQAALELASTVFGGFFGSRLNLNLREDKGYSYGASAYVDPRRGPGPLMASSAVRADVTGPAVKEFYNELEGLKSRPISKQELDAAREGLIRSLPGSFNSVEDLNSAAAGLYWEERPLDYYKKLVERLEGASLEQVQAAAVKYFDPAELDLVLVGDPDMVMTQMGQLGFGDVQLHQPPVK
ncbi:MAG: pitrilysin family protein [Myxococcaceae bacterium]